MALEEARWLGGVATSCDGSRDNVADEVAPHGGQGGSGGVAAG